MPPITDGGPIYTETNPEVFIKEPFNSASAIFFAIIAIYWLIKLRGQYREKTFLTASMVILLVGGLGGFLFHAFRSSRVFLLLDVLPILFLCIAVSLYFWRKVATNRAVIFFVPSLFLLLSSAAFFTVSRSTAINFQYGLLGLTVLAPIVIHLSRTQYQHASWIVIAVLCFSLALTCRYLDAHSPLSIGTHWLWHSFASIAVIYLIRYLKEQS